MTTPVLIRLGFRQVIDAATAQTDFERNILTDSLNEFRLQIQTYDQDNRFTIWQDDQE